MPLPLRLGLQGRVDPRLSPLGPRARLAAAPRRDLPQTLQALFGKPLTPQRDRVAIDADRRGDAQIGSALGGSQYDPATQCNLLGSPVCGQPLLKLLTLRGGEGQGPARIRHTVSIVDTDVSIQLFAGHYTSRHSFRNLHSPPCLSGSRRTSGSTDGLAQYAKRLTHSRTRRRPTT